MKTIAYAAVLLLTAASAACSSSTEKTPDTGNGTSGSSGTTTPAPTATTDPPATSSGTPADTTPKAPTLSTVEKMAGALMVTWTNADTSCDSIEGERQAQMTDGTIMEKYKVAFTLPGEADNKHDTTATEAMKYTYRLRCKKGGAYSPYSNEVSGTPK